MADDPALPTRAEGDVGVVQGFGASEARYSIRVTSRLTAIELETLRIWERRYGFPRPRRTAGGARMYCASEVEALKLIRRALEHGYRPGEVVGKSATELANLILVASQGRTLVPAVEPGVESMLAALAGDDVVTLRAELRRAAVALGPERFVVEVAHPLAQRVGDLWAGGKLEVRHEHLLSECLSAQLRLIAASFEPRSGAPRVLLVTLPGERHGLGLEMIEVYLAARAITPLRLGVDTPPEQIVEASRAHGADAVGLLVTRASDLAATAKQVRWMLGELPRRVGIWIGGAGAPELQLTHESVRVVASWSDLDAAIGALPVARS